MTAAVLAWALCAAPDDVRDRMIARGVPADEVVVPFAADERVARFAQRSVGDAREPVAKADKLFAAVSELVTRGAIHADRDNSPKGRRPKTAIELLATADAVGPGIDREAGCYEFSVLFVALARAVGLDAVGVAREQTLETGQIGHIMAAVRFEAGGRLTLFDLQNRTRGSLAPARELDDLELAAHHYNHLSVAAYLAGHYERARAAIDWALRLAPESAGFLANRATTLAALGEIDLAVAEAVAAVEIAPDVPVYRYSLGRLFLQQHDLAGARAALGEAVRLHPRYGLARRDLGWALLLAGEPAAAERELTEAARMRPPVPEAALYLGLYDLARGRRAAALEVAKKGLASAPGDRSLSALAQLAGDAAVRAEPAELERLQAVLRAVPATGAAARTER